MNVTHADIFCNFVTAQCSKQVCALLMPHTMYMILKNRNTFFCKASKIGYIFIVIILMEIFYY